MQQHCETGVSPCERNDRNLFGNVDTCLKRLFLVCTWFADLHWTQIFPVSDWLTQRGPKRPGRARPFPRSGETLVFITTSIVATVAGVSSFSETCLPTEVQNSSTKPFKLHDATRAEACLFFSLS